MNTVNLDYTCIFSYNLYWKEIVFRQTHSTPLPSYLQLLCMCITFQPAPGSWTTSIQITTSRQAQSVPTQTPPATNGRTYPITKRWRTSWTNDLVRAPYLQSEQILRVEETKWLCHLKVYLMMYSMEISFFCVDIGTKTIS